MERTSRDVSAEFDDDNLIARAGLVPVMTLADAAGLSDLVAEHVTVPGSIGSNADVKVASLVAGMVAGADSISDMDLLRHGGMDRRSPSAGADNAAHPEATKWHLLGELSMTAPQRLGEIAPRQSCRIRLIRGNHSCEPPISGEMSIGSQRTMRSLGTEWAGASVAPTNSSTSCQE